MKLKLCILAVLILTLTLSFVACGGGDTPKPNGGSSGSATEALKPDSGKLPEVPDQISEEFLKAFPETAASDFKVEDYEGGVTISKYTGSAPVVVIPESIDGKTVVAVYDYLFSNDSQVRAVRIPATVKKLEGTFANNQCIEVVICDGLENCATMTFFNCPKLHTVFLGEKLQTIGYKGVSNCPALKELYIAPSVTGIDDADAWSVGYYCPELTIVGEAGSYAETLAKENELPFRAK